MELKEALLKRRSVRKFFNKEIEEEKIDYILHAAMSGPSACNLKPWKFYVIRNKEKIAELRKSSEYANFESNLIICVVGVNQPQVYWVEDCSAATENILLACTDSGLGAVWCAIHPRETKIKKVREILDLKENEIPLNIIHIGYPVDEPTPRDQYEEKNVKFID